MAKKWSKKKGEYSDTCLTHVFRFSRSLGNTEEKGNITELSSSTVTYIGCTKRLHSFHNRWKAQCRLIDPIVFFLFLNTLYTRRQSADMSQVGVVFLPLLTNAFVNVYVGVYYDGWRSYKLPSCVRSVIFPSVTSFSLSTLFPLSCRLGLLQMRTFFISE